jgi:hypothetical protein
MLDELLETFYLKKDYARLGKYLEKASETYENKAFFQYLLDEVQKKQNAAQEDGQVLLGGNGGCHCGGESEK